MHKLVVLYPPPADCEHFRKHYVEVHLPLAARLPGLRASRHAFEISAPDGGPAPWFCIFEADFDDRDALDDALASPEGQAVAADVPNYASGGAALLRYEVVDG